MLIKNENPNICGTGGLKAHTQVVHSTLMSTTVDYSIVFSCLNCLA